MTTIATLSPLSSPEERKLANLEDTIERGLKSFVEVGLSLTDIRDSKLYRAEFETFEAYCKVRWKIARSKAYRYMEAAQVVEDLSQIGDTVPTDESHARILAEIPTTEKQADAWTQAVAMAPNGKDGEPKVTAAHVRRAVQQVMQPAAVPSEEPEDSPDDPTDISEPPAEPNELGELGENIDASYRLWTDGKPPRFKVFVDDRLRRLMDA